MNENSNNNNGSNSIAHTPDVSDTEPAPPLPAGSEPLTARELSMWIHGFACAGSIVEENNLTKADTLKVIIAVAGGLTTGLERMAQDGVSISPLTLDILAAACSRY